MGFALRKPKSKPARKRSRTTRPEPAVTKTAKPASQAFCPPPDELDNSVPNLKHLGGSRSDIWNQSLCNQAMNAAWYGSDPQAGKDLDNQRTAVLAFLAGVNPKDTVEGMMAAQLFASHAAAMECYRRAMLPGQTAEGRQMNLAQAAKLTRANAAQVEALAKHRNKGRQKITIEHVHVYQGGQAAFIANGSPGEGVAKLNEAQPHAIGYAPGAPMRCENPQGLALPVASNAERALPNARGTLAGRA
jgi:hypothetical protein